MPSLVRLLALAVFCVPVCAADLDKLAPADAGAAAVLNVKNLTDSALFKKHAETWLKAELEKNEQLARFCQTAAFDPFKGLTSITATAPLIFTANEPRWCVLVRGNFNARFQLATLAAAKAQGDAVKIATRGDRTYFTVPLPPEQNLIATFIGYDTIALANNADYLDDALAGSRLMPSQEAQVLRAAVTPLDGKRTLLAGIGIGDDLRKQLPSNPQFKQYTRRCPSSTCSPPRTSRLRPPSPSSSSTPRSPRRARLSASNST
jgi:hypothetical protein